MSLVLDCSATLAFLLPDEAAPAAQTLLSRIAEDGAWVPSLWRLEVANALSVAVRRGRILAAFRRAALHDLAELDIRTDPATDSAAWGATLDLADKHRLTLYDAAYLELARRRNLPLASYDADLRKAAIAESISVLLA